MDDALTSATQAGAAAPAHPGSDQHGVAAPGAAAPAQTARPLSRWRLLGFAQGAFASSVLLIPMAFYLPQLYTGELGISLNQFALIILISRTYDVALDPIVGALCDWAPDTRWGRRRPWLLLSTPALMLATAWLLAPRLFGPVTMWGILGAFCLMSTAGTVQSLNSQAWGAELTDDYHERTRIFGWRGAVAGVAPLVAFVILMVVERTNPNATTAYKLAAIALVVVVLMPICTLVSVFSVGEGPVSQVKRTSNFWGEAKAVLTNTLLLRLIAISVLWAVPFSISASVMVFYLRWVLHASDLTSTILLFTFLAGVVGVPIWMRIGRGREKHRVLGLSCLGTGVLLLPLYFFHAGDALPFTLITMSVSVAAGAFQFIMSSIMGDVAEADAARDGQRRTGTFFAILEMTTKAAPTLGTILVFPYLQWQGFNPNAATNTPQALQALRVTFAFFPAIPVLLCAWLLYTFPFGSKEYLALKQTQSAE